jgi:hypothetical protein
MFLNPAFDGKGSLSLLDSIRGCLERSLDHKIKSSLVKLRIQTFVKIKHSIYFSMLYAFHSDEIIQKSNNFFQFPSD